MLEPLEGYSQHHPSVQLIYFEAVLSGLEKNLNSSLPFGQVALKFCLPWASVRLLFLRFSWQDDLPGTLPIGQVRMKSDLSDRKIYLSQTTGRHFFRALFVSWALPIRVQVRVGVTSVFCTSI